MYTRIQKWGNSKAFPLPKAIVEDAGLNEEDRLNLTVKDGSIILTPYKKHIKLADRVAEYDGRYKPGEWDTGEPEGDEIW